MDRPRYPLALCLLVLTPVLWACASSNREAPPRNPRYISAEELEAAGVSADLYTVVQRLRPVWLRRRGPHTLTGGDDIRVYVDGMGYASPAALRFYQATDVESLAFLDAGRATVRFGTGHTHGAIVVLTRGGGAAAAP